MGDTARVIEWNGRDVPSELAQVPPGRYRLVAIDDDEALELAPAWDSAIEQGLDDVRAGRTVPWETVKAELAAKIAARAPR